MGVVSLAALASLSKTRPYSLLLEHCMVILPAWQKSVLSGSPDKPYDVEMLAREASSQKWWELPLYETSQQREKRHFSYFGISFKMCFLDSIL